jgi:hypothetical protein
VSNEFLIGAILGSGLAIAFGRAPAQRALARVQSRIQQRRPK